jgi:hypothetical protein
LKISLPRICAGLLCLLMLAGCASYNGSMPTLGGSGSGQQASPHATPTTSSKPVAGDVDEDSDTTKVPSTPISQEDLDADVPYPNTVPLEVSKDHSATLYAENHGPATSDKADSVPAGTRVHARCVSKLKKSTRYLLEDKFYLGGWIAASDVQSGSALPPPCADG